MKRYTNLLSVQLHSTVNKVLCKFFSGNRKMTTTPNDGTLICTDDILVRTRTLLNAPHKSRSANVSAYNVIS